MPTNFPAVQDATLQKFLDALVACVRFPDGSAPSAAPNAFRDGDQNPVPLTNITEVDVKFRVTATGLAAVVSVQPLGSAGGPVLGAYPIAGVVDITTLASKLA
jgi:hypothetical protein